MTTGRGAHEPADNKPADNKPADNKPADNKPADNKPADNKPADNRPSVDELAGPTRPLVVLVGAPGAGKTTVGTLLASRLGVTLRDTDTDVEAAVGLSVSDIFIEHGEETFRAAERAAVAAALAEHPGVLALGGGAVLAEETRAALVGHSVVYLDVDVHDAAKRVGLARDRPLLIEAPRTRLTALLRERRPLYEAVATVVVETAGRTPDEVADAVLAALPGTLAGR